MSTLSENIPCIGGHVYLVSEYDHTIMRYVSELKVGYSDDVTKRLKGYPRGSRLIYAMLCEDAPEAERQAITAFHEISIHRGDRGNEYFEIDNDLACTTLGSIVQTVNAQVTTRKALEAGLDPKRPMEPILVLLEFVDAHRERLDGIIVVAKELYDEAIAFIEKNRIAVRFGFNFFINELQRSYNVTYKPAVVIGGTITPCFHFPRLIVDTSAMSIPDRENHSGTVITGILPNTKVIISDMDRVAGFAKEFIKEDPGKFFTLKQAKEAYIKSKWFNGKVGYLKEELERVLGSACYEQKKIGGHKLKNVFMGFTMEENIISSEDV